MNSHFITDIKIQKLRHLHDINIHLDKTKPKHLLLTGKNGSGKTTTLNAIKRNLKSIETDQTLRLVTSYKKNILQLEDKLKVETNEQIRLQINHELEDNITKLNQYAIHGVDVHVNCEPQFLSALYQQGNFILAYFDSNRKTNVQIPNGVEKIELKPAYSLDENPSQIFVKYLVDLKTQQSFARNEEDMETVHNIDHWFNQFETALKTILDDQSITLKFDYRNYNFKILQQNREPYALNELSEGYSAILNIVSDLILRIDKNRAGTIGHYIFDTEGIVLIDELETHLHIELQKTILPFLIDFFPKLQFIVTTHSPFVLSSIDNAIIYDLEKNIRVEGLSDYSYEGVVEGYFEVDNYSNELKEKIQRYKGLAFRTDLTEDEKANRAELRIELKNAANNLAKELMLEFNAIEEQRKQLT